MNRIDESATYTLDSFCTGALHRLWQVMSSIINRMAVDVGGSRKKFLIKIVRAGFGLRDGQRQDTLGFDGNHIILVLQNSFDHQELLGGYQ
jgi:hypothetical protein